MLSKRKIRTREVNGAVHRALSEAGPKQHVFYYDSFQLPTPPTAYKTLEVAFFLKEKTYIL